MFVQHPPDLECIVLWMFLELVTLHCVRLEEKGTSLARPTIGESSTKHQLHTSTTFEHKIKCINFYW